MKTLQIAAVAMGVTLLGGQAFAAGPPAAVKPTRVAGAAVYAADLEAEKTWYMDKLGMGLVRSYDRDGKPWEYVLSVGGRPDAAHFLLGSSTRRPPGPNNNSRLVLACPDAKALAAYLKTVGVEAREVTPGVAYSVTDPEGNEVELYTPPGSPAQP